MKLSTLTCLVLSATIGTFVSGSSLRRDRQLQDIPLLVLVTEQQQQDSDACANVFCNERSKCEAGECLCLDGFIEPPVCRDLDECTELENPPCAFPGVVCVDEDPNGPNGEKRGKFDGGMYHCACRTMEGWIEGPEFDDHGPTSCLDKNECLNDPCGENAECTNLEPDEGRFMCTCTADLVFDSNGNCVEPIVPEEIVRAPCASANDCLDTDFSVCDATLRKCVCLEGYFQGSIGLSCKPRNFCEEGNDDCSEFATCNPILGDPAGRFFSCSCGPGYFTPSGVVQGKICVSNQCSLEGSCTSEEHCVELPPPETFLCIPRTPDPTPSPTPNPTQPKPAPPPINRCIGVTCGNSGASCVPATGQCVCNQGLSGDGTDFCVDAFNIIPDTIFGTGNSNGGFTTTRQNGIEIGLRAKVVWDHKDQPTERSLTYAYDFDRTYTFVAGNGETRNSLTLARWNVDWHINVDYLGTSGKKVSDYVYSIALDDDPAVAVSAYELEGDSISTFAVGAGNSFGDNTNRGNEGDEATDLASYQQFLDSSNVVQNSFNYLFVFNGAGAPFGPLFNPEAPGTYTIRIQVKDKADPTIVVAEKSIDVVIVSGEISSNVIFGSGNSNGNFVTSFKDGVELGLRGKVRFVGDNNADSDGTYNFETGLSTMNDEGNSLWNFEWSVNTNRDGTTSGKFLKDYTYELMLDFDPTAAIGVFPATGAMYDPISLPDAPPTFYPPGNYFGTSNTAQGGGQVAMNRAEYTNFLETSTIVEQSFNLGFVDVVPITDATFDPQAEGIYSISLAAKAGGVVINSVNITIFATPP